MTYRVEDEEKRLRDDYDLAAGVEAAWTGFRARLADHLAAMTDDGVLCVEVQTGAEEELDDAAPYVQFCAYGDDMVHVEAVSNWYLDDRYALTSEGEHRLVELGWNRPHEDEDGYPETGWENFSFDAERRDADRVAALSVTALREVYGVVHPVFLEAEGLEVDPDAPRPPADSRGTDEQEEIPLVAFAQGPEELQELVDATILDFLDEDEVSHDEDGDIPILAGLSTLYVRVLRDRPAVEIFADLVIGVADAERVPLEVGVLNAGHPFARFVIHDDRVSMNYVLCAIPFAPGQLRMVLGHLLTTVDDLARDLAARVRGRRFLDEPPDDTATQAPYDADPSLVGLMEVLHVKAMSASAVAAMFDHDRTAIVRALVGLRTGRIACTEHDLDLVLDHLRRGLSVVAIRSARAEQAAARRSRTPRSQQLSLLPEADTLDSGQWEREIS